MKTIYLIDTDDSQYNVLFLVKDEVFEKAKKNSETISLIWYIQYDDANRFKFEVERVPHLFSDSTSSLYHNIFMYLVELCEFHFQGELSAENNQFDFVIEA